MIAFEKKKKDFLFNQAQFFQYIHVGAVVKSTVVAGSIHSC